MSTTCIVCGQTLYFDDDLCADCEERYKRDIREKRLPPPMTDPSLLLKHDWIHIRTMERDMSEAGKTREEIRQAVYEYTSQRQDELLSGRESSERERQRKANASAKLEERYSY